jgi:hypothetical protein
MTEYNTCRKERRARRLREMVERLNCDARSLAVSRRGGDYAEACATCLACAQSDECVRWLDENPSSAMPAFCPNLSLLLRFAPGA